MRRLLLIGCVASKASTPMHARVLYKSQLFRARRDYADAAGCPWAIVSAHEMAIIEPNQLMEHEDTYPLDVVFCTNCALMQILQTVSPTVLYDESYRYFSSNAWSRTTGASTASATQSLSAGASCCRSTPMPCSASSCVARLWKCTRESITSMQ